MSKNKLHYSWIMFVFLIFSAFIFVGLCSNTVSLFVQPVSDAFGFSRGSFTLKNCLASMIAGAFSLFFGKLAERFTLKSIIVFGGVSLIVCYITQAKATSLGFFYISALFQGLGVGACSMAAITLAVNRWFSARFGMLFGVIYTATSVGGALFFPLIGSMIENNGYAAGFIFIALCVAAYLIVLLLVFCERPAQKGLQPMYSNEAPIAEVQKAQTDGIPFAQATHSPLFIPSIILMLLVSMTGTSIQGTMTARLVDVGFSLSFSTSIVSVLYIFTSLFKIPAGLLADRRGILPVLNASLCCSIAALILLIVVKTPLVAYLMTPFMGASMVLFTVPAPLIGPTLFGRRDVEKLTGVYMGMQNLGTALGQTIFNFMYDASGSYVSSYILCIVIMGLCIIGFTALIKKNPRNWLLGNQKQGT